MTGQVWEQLQFPVIADSGARVSVMFLTWCEDAPTQPTPQSEAKESIRAANGNKTYNKGRRVISMMAREGAMRDINLIICAVTQAFGSMSEMRRAGHKVRVQSTMWPRWSVYTALRNRWQDVVGRTQWVEHVERASCAGPRAECQHSKT